MYKLTFHFEFISTDFQPRLELSSISPRPSQLRLSTKVGTSPQLQSCSSRTQPFSPHQNLLRLRPALRHLNIHLPLFLLLRKLIRFFLFLRRCMTSITRVPQTREHDHGHEHDGENGTPGKDPANTFDFGFGVGVEGDGDFVVDFLDLWCVLAMCTRKGKVMRGGATYGTLHASLLHPNLHLPVIEHSSQVILQTCEILRQFLV